MRPRVSPHLSVLAVGVLGLAPQAPVAQDPRPVRPESRPPLPWLRVPDNRRSQPMRLATASLRVEVVGGVATTSWDLSFENPNDQVLEGELVFPLAPGQRISRFALEVNGRLREGVVVDKAKGREAFEATVRRGVDPGLLEQAEGQAFRTRVYPLPPHGAKRVVLAYEERLSLSAEGARRRLNLPLAFHQTVDRLNLEILVHGQGPAPTVRGLEGLDFQRTERCFRAQAQARDFRADRTLHLDIPRPRDEGRAFLGREAGTCHFQALVPVPEASARREAPRQALLYWDVSQASKGRDFAKVWALLEGHLKAHPLLRLDVATFSIAVHQRRTFAPGPDRLRALRSFLESQAADGAAQFGVLDFAPQGADEVLLASEGLSTFGQSEAIPGAVPVVTCSSAPGGDPARLQGLAEATGGRHLDLQALDLATALQRLEERPLRCLKVTPVEGAVADLEMAPLEGLEFQLFGRLQTPTARLRLEFGRGGTVLFSRTVELRADGALPTSALRRAWAAQRLERLARRPSEHREQIKAHCLAQGLVGPDTSLLVLDTLEDYLRYRIEPPEELREAYHQRLKDLQEDDRGREKAHLEAVVRQYRERIAWWETVFKPAPVVREPKENGARSSLHPRNAATLAPGFSGGAMGRPSPPPPPPASVAMEMADARRESTLAALPSPRLAKAAALDSPGTPAAPAQVQVALAPWDSKAPYLQELRGLSPTAIYPAYLRLKALHGASGGFYQDVAELLHQRGREGEALRVLSNLAVLDLENAALLRVLAHRLHQWKALPLARACFERILALRSEEPQSHRDLALVLEDMGERHRALEALWGVVRKPWDGRFPGIHALVAGEMNALIARSPVALDTRGIDPRLLKALPVDVRVVLTWDTDNCDMDLWVTDPRGEKCYYGHNRTSLGGRLSEDYTQGYGPEEFMLRRGFEGTYRVQVNYYGDHSQRVAGPTSLTLSFFTHYGSARQTRKDVTVRLSGRSETLDVGSFAVQP